MNYPPFVPYVPAPNKPVRKGAADALNIPSLSNGVRVEYKKPVAMCVGTLKSIPSDFAK